MYEGKARAKEKDENFREGRKKKYTPQQLDHALSLLGEYSYKKVSELTGISVSTLTRAHKKIPPEKY